MTVSHPFVARGAYPRGAALVIAVAIAALAGGCANDAGNFFTTGSLTEPTPVAAVAKPDPVCVNLSSQITALRSEGTVERLEKAADGKTAAVNVQRTALAKQAQLNKLNADFIAKCGPVLPKATTTAVAQPATAPTTAAPTKTAAAAPAKTAQSVAKAAAAKDVGVTIAPPTGVQN